ncbi:MAG: hypothetical protein IIB07_06945 [Bacteroidetes bacterium]|nr:hypothetical protein [Bacteroidota bacterium]
MTKEFDYQWSVQTIRKNRRKMGIDRTSGEKQESIAGDLSSSLPPHGLSEKEKAMWFIKYFKRSYLFSILQEQFSLEEVNFYLEEYGRICCQFEDIVTSEFFQIEKYLKHRILINRQLVFTNVLQEEIKELTLWIKDHPIQEGGSPEIMKKRVQDNFALEEKRGRLQEAHIRYDKLIGEEEKMLKSLNATRASRIEQLSGGKESFFNLVVAMQHSEKERDRQGKHAELTRIASENIYESGLTQWCHFSEDTWKLAHEERKTRAERMWKNKTWLSTKDSMEMHGSPHTSELNAPKEILNIDGVFYPNLNKPLRKSITNFNALDLLVSSSTGSMHIAAGLKVKTLSLFCPLKACSPNLWGPKGNESHILLPEENYCKTQCPGDPKICDYSGEGGIDASIVVNKIKTLLNLSD